MAQVSEPARELVSTHCGFCLKFKWRIISGCLLLVECRHLPWILICRVNKNARTLTILRNKIGDARSTRIPDG